MTLDWLLKNHKKSGMLLDANLLILFIVGRAGVKFIAQAKRTRTYTPDDYKLLQQIAARFTVFTTPHILTETSNLLEKDEKHIRQAVFQQYKIVAAQLKEITEPVKEVVSSKAFLKLGLSDSVIYELGKKGLLVLSDDFELCAYLNGHQLTAININHLRGEAFFGN